MDPSLGSPSAKWVPWWTSSANLRVKCHKYNTILISVTLWFWGYSLFLGFLMIFSVYVHIYISFQTFVSILNFFLSFNIMSKKKKKWINLVVMLLCLSEFQLGHCSVPAIHNINNDWMLESASKWTILLVPKFCFWWFEYINKLGCVCKLLFNK